MNTLIEIYDERPLHNVLSTEMFRPERTVFICPPEICRNKALQRNLEKYFAGRGIPCCLEFVEASLLDAEDTVKALRETAVRWPGCALDIAGGTDASLFAGGLFCADSNTPVFTYSRKRNTFFNIRSAPFAQNVPCSVELRIEDCFLMAGGSMRTGRVDNGILEDYVPMIGPFFALYMKYRRDWASAVAWFQRISQPTLDDSSCKVSGAYRQKGPHNSLISAPEALLRDLESLGVICSLQLAPDSDVSFTFRDSQWRTWLRDIGSVLELYVWQACRETEKFSEVRTSVIADWTDGVKADPVSNEIDVMAIRGVQPLFISCKTCEVKTEALNELAILRDRFGGTVSRAAIVTTRYGGSAMRRRAMELGITVIDLKDMNAGALPKLLRSLAG